MTIIEQASQGALEFLKRNLQTDNVNIRGAAKVDDGWMIEAEAFEPNTLIKALGLPARVPDRHIYTVKLNPSLEVETYERR